LGASKSLYLKERAACKKPGNIAADNSIMNARKLFLNRRGQSIVELTLITPLLLAALYVAMDFGIMFFTTHYTQNAVREGSRIGSIMPDCAIDAGVPCVGTVTQSCSSATAMVVTQTCQRLPQALTGASVAVTLTGVYDPPTCMREIRVAASGTYIYGLYRVMTLFGLPVPANPLITRIATGRYQGQPVTVTGAC
jgi:Flp pilus assembly protein TadG